MKIRHKVLVALNERVASPKELAAELGEPLGNVSYHTRVLAHGLHPVLAGLAAEAAVHRHAEVVEEARCRGVAAAQARDAVDRQHDAEEHPRVARVELGERAEVALVLAAQVARAGHVDPVDRPL